MTFESPTRSSSAAVAQNNRETLSMTGIQSRSKRLLFWAIMDRAVLISLQNNEPGITGWWNTRRALLSRNADFADAKSAGSVAQVVRAHA